MKIKEYSCAYCGSTMIYKGTKSFRLGKLALLLGSDSFTGPLELSIYECGKCGKLDFFRYKRPKGDKA